ncbi:HAD family hydrolase [Herbaspirillum sp. alder98]|uniref:HAD family hydrolase n=1 Tax=Herbaspirillum sp. alder98 TaxID=2913096 RepID=UPI001CD8F964|nr:HAD family phosphatase [Herbaspirillum sp. alder98]MCA1326508.1 HAD family phosphatase [Herbaspirillum sp. alder98]
MNPTLTTPGIRAVVFDFGGVLFDWSPLHVYQQLIADDEERRRFLRDVCSPLWNVQQDAGRTLAEGTELLVAEHPQHASLIRAFYDRWTEMLRGPLDDGVTLLKDLHASRMPLFGLTNWSAETFPYARDNYDFLDVFQDIVVSGDEKCIKPDPRIYEIALARYGAHLPDLKPDELVFIDDLKINVDAAQALGWHGILHVDAAHTRAELNALGIVV